MYSPTDKPFLTTGEALGFLGISKAYFYKLKKERSLRTYTIGGRKSLYKREDLLTLVDVKAPSHAV